MPNPVSPFPRLPETFTQAQLEAIMAAIDPHVYSPWAVVLVRFRDNSDPHPPVAHFEDLFTASGTGRFNMVDFFRDMSHQRVDVSGSKVFGPFELPYDRTDYLGNVNNPPDGKLNRDRLHDAGRMVALANGVDLGAYAGLVVLVLQTWVDTCGWTGQMKVLCDTGHFSSTGSTLGQEMGHGYGLQHSRLHGSDDDYRDPYDVMSTNIYLAMEVSHPEWEQIGPGLNAWNMRSLGWLREDRVWRVDEAAFDETIELRPLHHTNDRGWLAAELGEYLVEFRVPERWDAAIGTSRVLVHRWQDGHSYLMPSTTRSPGMVEGGLFEDGQENFWHRSYLSVRVLEIDSVGRRARIKLVKRPAQRLLDKDPLAWKKVLGGIAADGPGFVIANGKIHRVPPRSPQMRMVENIGRYLDVRFFETGVDRSLAEQRDALLAVIGSAAQLYARIESVSAHPYGEKGKVHEGAD